MTSPDELASGALVLVADDDDDMRAFVCDALRGEGYLVREARDGAELVELLDDPSIRPSLVVTDVKMPRLSGLGVLQALRHDHWDLPVVVMTVFADDSVRNVARQLGAVGVLHKPFEPEDMLSIVRDARRAVDLRRARPLG